MAATWPGSRIPYIDENGDPMVGAQLYFFDEGTTTPQTVYSDSALGEAIAQPILADARGAFPMIYLQAGTYRQRLLDADGVTIFDDDGISVPQASDYVPPDAGDTSEELLARTGDLKWRYGTGTHSGWVRCNGRTIGSASSGATERANADAEDLFLHLWTADSNLTVSSGRGGSAASDWAANKTIALPDARSRTLVALGTMGNTAAGIIDASLLDDSATADTLGAKGGADDVTLTSTQIPSHSHTGSGTTGTESAGHVHAVTIGPLDGRYGSNPTGGATPVSWGAGDSIKGQATTTVNSSDISNNHTHSYSFTTSSTGGGGAHTNLQPSMLASLYIKL